MSRPANKLIPVLLLVLLCGCAHMPDTRSVRHKQATAWANQGEKAYLAGSLEQSRQYYERALQINTSIENTHGIASDMLSLAQINLARGEYEQAGAKLQFILDDRNHLFAPADKAGAAARSAQLALLLKQPDKTMGLAQQAEALCSEGCVLGASILNLQAQAAMALGRMDEGADMAKRAGAIADQLQQPVELANAQRLQGEMLLRRSSAAQALPLLGQALALDKQQGLPGKIAADLHLLAEVQDMLGRHAEAESLRSRERAVRGALGDKGQ